VIHAHRVVLAHHSEAFRELFTNSMAKETSDGVVTITDFSLGSVGAVLI